MRLAGRYPLGAQARADGKHHAVGERDTLRHVADVCAEHRHDGAAVMGNGTAMGCIDVQSLLDARRHDLTEATEREQVLIRPLGVGRAAVAARSRHEAHRR